MYYLVSNDIGHYYSNSSKKLYKVTTAPNAGYLFDYIIIKTQDIRVIKKWSKLNGIFLTFDP